MMDAAEPLSALMASALLPGTLRADDLEPDYLAADCWRQGKLPTARRIACRKMPRVVNVAAMGRLPGQYGGTCGSLIGSQKDIRLMTIYGYARLVGYDEKLKLQPDILESFECRGGSHLHLQDPRRPQMVGRRAADVRGLPLLLGGRAVSNEDLSPGGLPPALLVDGKPPISRSSTR